ncbi:hypothetical protein SH139x_001445 [Planctomycetaceae bacterium SH139]
MSSQPSRPHVVVIRSWPKMIFLWPTALTSLIAGLLTWFAPDWSGTLGHIFVLIFTLNLAVLTFDFPRSTSLTIFIAVISLGLGVILLNQQFGIIAPVQSWFASLDIAASSGFYLAIFVAMLVLFTGMAIVTRFDYWELTNNELIHHTGLLGDVERYSTAGLKLNTELNDVFEYLLAGAGRIIMNIPGHPRPFVLDNVLRINKVLVVSKDLLSRRIVEVSQSGGENKQTEEDRQTAEYE